MIYFWWWYVLQHDSHINKYFINKNLFDKHINPCFKSNTLSLKVNCKISYTPSVIYTKFVVAVWSILLTMSSVQTGHPELDQKIEEWLTWDKNQATCDALKGLVAENKVEELKKILLNRLSFGTAGLRGRMAVGYACMNDLVIVQTAQGYLKYLEKENIDLLKRNGIVVGYDGRHNSRRYVL